MNKHPSEADKAGTEAPEGSTPAVGEGGIRLTWENEAAATIRGRAHGRDGRQSSPYMVALIGLPGSGKSTSAGAVAAMLSDMGCVVMPVDGYHYPKRVLESFPDAQDAVYRRGAPDTFDTSALQRDLRRVRYGDEAVVTVPGFDHAQGDPAPDAHRFVRDDHKIVLCEGLYLLHDEDGWEEIAAYFDYSIFINSDVDACVDRLKIRNRCIPGYTPEEIDKRCEVVDRANAITVLHQQSRADWVVSSAADAT